MKKCFLIIVVIIVGIVILSPSNQELRLRVIANSNNYFDQEIKLKVVKELSQEIIDLENLDIIKEKTEYILQNNQCFFQVIIKIEKQTFPTKYYNDKIIKGGSYQTIVIIIGQGLGNNYWSILYPEYFGLCFDDVETGNVEYKSWFRQWFE